MNYLRPETSAYHIRAVRLIWDLERATTEKHLESIISQMLSSSSARDGYDAYDAFGVLWRLSDDAQQPGMRFKVPMLIVFETLKSSDPVLRRLGETWMRCNLKSYMRYARIHLVLSAGINMVSGLWTRYLWSCSTRQYNIAWMS